MRSSARVVRELGLGLVACLLALGGGVAVASAPIKPNQHFVGIVNGGASTTAVPVVYTVCAGPIWPGRTGPVAGGQSLAVARVARDGGFTGPYSQVYAWFVEDSSASGPQQVRFTTYATTMAIPATVEVPCDGSGRVEFSPCPYGALCVAGFTPAMVKVRFENIAV
jgi:hypothetical protein